MGILLSSSSGRTALRHSPSTFHLWTGPVYDEFFWSVDVDDADNDGFNEVVIAMYRMKIRRRILYQCFSE
jgi:hypothetical protein